MVARAHRYAFGEDNESRCACGAREFDEDGEERDNGPCTYPRRYVVAIYELDEARGGPEEGGWWYTTGKLERIVRIVKDEQRAYRIARRMNERLAFLRKRSGARCLSSVLYDGGHYSAEIYENFAPEYFPTHRPHYE